MHFIYCLFVTILIIQLPAFNIQRARVRERIHMQIIAVGVTNRRDQHKARFIAFVDPFGLL